MIKRSPFRYFKTSLGVILLAVMLCAKSPLSHRNVRDHLHASRIDVSHETVRFWQNRFGPMFAAEIHRKRFSGMRCCPNWRWHLDEMSVNIDDERLDFLVGRDCEDEVLEEQSRQEVSSAFSTTRTHHTPLSSDAKFAEISRRPCWCFQPFSNPETVSSHLVPRALASQPFHLLP